jgi:hypothetical protein
MSDNQAARFGVTPATRAEVRRLLGTDPTTDLGFEEHAPEPGSVVLVMRVPAAHTANSHVERCTDCNHKVWVAATTSPDLIRVCIACLPERLARDKSTSV